MSLVRACRIALAPLAIICVFTPTVTAQSVFINEFHYDNVGTDAGEFIEIAGLPGTDIGGWSIVLYNGLNGRVYTTPAPTFVFGAGTTIPAGPGLGVLVVAYPVNGIQNGDPDGIALVDDLGTVVEFLSYEGSFTALDGPAIGISSTAIIAAEGSVTAIGHSLQRTGNGCEGETFVWAGPAAASSGSLNGGQEYDDEACGMGPPPPPPFIDIYDIQGARHISPYVGKQVVTAGIVTAVAFDGYYVQDPIGDGDVATSDAIFVFIGASGLKPSVGDRVRLQDVVQEFFPGGAGGLAAGSLSVTELAFPLLTVLSNGNPLPSSVVIGTNGRVPPGELVISPGELPVNLQNVAGAFNPAVDGIDFYESLEGMLVTVQAAVAVSALQRFGNFSSELFTLSNNGATVAPATARTARGGINLQPHPDNRGDQNPERVQLQFDASPDFVGTLYPGAAPLIKVGDRLGDVIGLMSYDFGNFEVRLTQLVSVVAPSPIVPETTSLVGDKHKLTMATYNVQNLSPDPSDDPQRNTLAGQIVNRLKSPDILALQEIQDNSGEIDDGVTDASVTLTTLANAIAAAGGPVYDFIDVPPVDGSSGGVPGGNIRTAYLYNPARVRVEEVMSLTPPTLTQLAVSNPGAFTGSRSPLLVEFKFQGRQVTVINNHLSSRSGSTAIFGGSQPVVQAAETAREAQASVLNEVVDALIPGNNGLRHVVVLGDFNTFEFTNDLTDLLPGTGDERVLVNLIPTLTDDNVYSYNFEGNAQVLDHVFVSRGIVDRAEIDIVHVNTDFPFVDTSKGSDHEPVVLRLNFASPNQ